MEEKVNYRGGQYYSSLLEQVRVLRKNQTEAEEIFWQIVRNRKFLGLKFRRQHQIRQFVVDFFCPTENLIIEIDGKIHMNPEQRERDHSRDHYLKELKYKVLRFSNDDIYNNIEEVLDEIKNVIE